MVAPSRCDGYELMTEAAYGMDAPQPAPATRENHGDCTDGYGIVLASRQRLLALVTVEVRTTSATSSTAWLKAANTLGDATGRTPLLITTPDGICCTDLALISRLSEISSARLAALPVRDCERVVHSAELHRR